MPVAWRVVKQKHMKHAFDGEGAKTYGGRWNSPGTRMIYLSESVALALLEILVHVDGTLLPNYAAIPVTFRDAMVSTLNRKTLPVNWRSYPAPAALRRAGDEWAKARGSALLKVPSVVVPEESNYLLNPEHPDFKKIRVGKPIRLKIDLRLLT